MTIKLEVEDALAYRGALEPLTRKMVIQGGEVHPQDWDTIPLASIAISLKRIADGVEALLEQNKFKR